MKQEPGLSWVSTDPGICPILQQLQQRSLFCDVSLLDDAGMILQAHACILAAGSPVLRNTLMLKQSLTLLKKQGVTLRISGVTHDIWTIILQFLYLNKVDIISDLNVIHGVHRVAKMLGIKSLESLIWSHVQELALQITLSGDIGAVNVTVAPTVAVQYQHRHTQTEKRPAQSLVKTAAFMTPTNHLDYAVASNLPKQDQSVGMGELTQVSVNDLKSPPLKRIKILGVEDQKNDIEMLQHGDLSAYQLPKETEVEVESEEDELEEVLEHSRKPVEPVRLPRLQRTSQVSCRYCSMLFDQKTALVDHLVERCPKVFKNRVFKTAAEQLDVESGSSSQLMYIKGVSFADDIQGTSNYRCINEECSARFTNHTAYMTHLTECVMDGIFINPRLHVTEVKGTLVYDDGHENLPDDAVEKPSATLIEIKSNVKMFMCTHCKLRGMKERMAGHLAIVHGKRKPYKCKNCSAKYGYFESFRDHYVSNHTNQTFLCEELGCGAVFNKKDSLRRHTLMDHKREGKEMHECSGCHKTFKYAHHARRHEKYHMGKDERQHTCATCNKAFVTKQDLDRHKDVHTGCKPYKCSQCFYTTARKSNLILHERKHGVVHGDYVCTTCMKYFISETRFKGHLNSLKHEGCRVDELPNHVVMFPNEGDTDRIVYQDAIEFDAMNTTPLTVESVANPEVGELQVVPLESIASDPALAEGMAALGNNNLVYVVTSGDDYVYNVVDSTTVLNS